jgi:hypothetical protein
MLVSKDLWNQHVISKELITYGCIGCAVRSLMAAEEQQFFFSSIIYGCLVYKSSLKETA